MIAIFSKYEPVIGLEVHAQMKTGSKAFCSCSTEFNAPPNTNVCPVCLGHPGTLPVLNRNLVEFILKMGISTNCCIREHSIFARKNYFYPDLPKGYQVSQFDTPICYSGQIEIKGKNIGITRIHMEEDSGKSIHDLHDDVTLVDLNRSGVPLIEIVSEPCIASPEEAHDYLVALKQTLSYLDICDGNMEEGSLRCDANVSVRLAGEKTLGTKTEVKNLNSFRNVADALECEITRQIEILSSGGEVIHQTLTYDAKSRKTSAMRSKEEAHDYRYFPEPDLLSVHVSDEWIEEVKKSLPELPAIRSRRFVNEFKLPEYDANLLTVEKEIADYYEEVCKKLAPGSFKTASNWVMTEVLRVLKESKMGIDEFPVNPANFSSLINLIAEGKISNNIAKEVYAEMLKFGKTDSKQDPGLIVKEKNLLQVTDSNEVEEMVKKVLNENPSEVTRYKNGETKLLGFLVGKVIKESKGKANPKTVNDLLIGLLS